MPEVDLPNADVDVEDVVDTPGGEQGTDAVVADNPATPEWFLEVDERTRFKTADEAKRSYNEAGQRIAQLAPYEKVLGKYGIKDPQMLPSLLDELIASREAKAAAGKAPKVEPKAEQNLSKEDKEIRAYLQKVAPELGFVSKSEIEKLTAEIAELRQGSTQSQEARTQSLVEDGESKISGFLSAAKIDDADGSKMKVVGTLVKSWIESDPSGELVERFFKGGRSMEAVVKEGYDQAMKTLGWQAAATTTVPNAAAATAIAKGKQIVVNKKLPAEGSASKAKTETKAPQTSGKRDYISELHDKARKVFEESL